MAEEGFLEYPAYAVVRNVWRDYAPRRSLTPEGKQPTRDEVIADMTSVGHHRVDTKTATGAAVVFLVLSSGGKAARHAADLLTLLKRVGVAAVEVVVIVEREFFKKKNLLEVVRGLQNPSGVHEVHVTRAERPPPQKGAAAPRAATLYGVHPYSSFVIPENDAMPIWRIMSAEEVAAYLERERFASVASLHKVPHDDPPVVAIGARPGQCVETVRPSETAGKASIVRHVI